MGSPTDANGVHPVGRAAHIRVTSLKTGFWGAYEDSDRDVAITPRLMGISSGIEESGATRFFLTETKKDVFKTLYNSKIVILY